MHVVRPFLSPLRGLLCIAFTRGFTPGYVLSALRACCRTVLWGFLVPKLLRLCQKSGFARFREVYSPLQGYKCHKIRENLAIFKGSSPLLNTKKFIWHSLSSLGTRRKTDNSSC